MVDKEKAGSSITSITSSVNNTSNNNNDNFESLAFEKTLFQLKDTQVGIQALSSWCLKNKHHHKRIVSSWLNVLKRAKIEHRLTLFYLANDVIQYSKKKNYEFVESWGTTLQRATPLVRDGKVKHRILRIFRIWEERSIYDEEFLADLTGLLSATTGKQSSDVDPNEFQSAALISRIKQCSVLEVESEKHLKVITENNLILNNIKTLGVEFKERKDADQAVSELESVIKVVENYVKSLEKELVAREALNRLLSKAHTHYGTQRGEVKVVATAYRNFGSRVKGLKRKLDDMCENLPSASNSPVPSPPLPDELVPSPSPDDDLELPNLSSSNLKIDQSIHKSISESFSTNDMSSFIGSDFSFSSFHDTKKTENSKVLSPPPPPPPLLPGLDLLSSTDLSEPPPSIVKTKINFYGSNISKPQPEEPSPSADVFGESGRNWNTPWNYSAGSSDVLDASSERNMITMVPPPTIIPHNVPPPILPPHLVPTLTSEQSLTGRYPDIDHRTLLAPPPPPQPLQMLLQTNDIDHRSLPPLPSTVSPLAADHNRKDVDHRNLISLTGFSTTSSTSTTSNLSWPLSQIDKNYHNTLRDFSPSIPPPSYRHPMQPNDNVESIDMEMSDEESHDKSDEYHNQADLSHAQMHGDRNRRSLSNTPYKKYNKFANTGDNNQRNNINMNANNPEMESGMRGNFVQMNDNEGERNDRHLASIAPPDQNVSFSSELSTNTPPKDIFGDFNNSMNPFNPNVSQPPPDFGNDSRLPSENEWEGPEDDSIYSEPEAWRNQFKAVNSPRPNMYRMPGQYTANICNTRFRPPLLPMTRPPFIRERGPQSDARGGMNNRRFWGPKPPRPNRGGYW